MDPPIVRKTPITDLLGVSFRKAGVPETCGQDLKMNVFFKVSCTVFKVFANCITIRQREHIGIIIDLEKSLTSDYLILENH